MEQEKQNLLEMIERPAFLVRDGVIHQCNQMARSRQITEGTPIAELLTQDMEAYQAFQDGVLYLTVDLGWTSCGATLTRHDGDDLFLLDRDSDRAQLQALALAAQQLRIPLSNIMNTGDLLFPQLEQDDQQDQAAQIRRGMFQLMRIIGNMADAGVYADASASKMEQTELGHFFQEVFEKSASALESAGIRVAFTGLKAPVYTLVDRERMERAAMNLLSNSAKFSKSGDCIEVKLTCNGRIAALSLEIPGQNIPNHIRGTLFNRYTREPALEDSRYGLGLGLTLARSVASAHGGTLLVDQVNGTRTTMTIAIRKDASGILRSPNLWIGDYSGGYDKALLELSDCLPWDAYKTDI